MTVVPEQPYDIPLKYLYIAFVLPGAIAFVPRTMITSVGGINAASLVHRRSSIK